MRKVAILSVIVACTGLVAYADEKDAPKLTAGSYSLISGKKAGADIDDMAKKSKYIIDAKTITIDGDLGKFVMTYKLDTKAKPISIDMVMEDSPIPDLKGSKAFGIIELKGETLKLAYALEKDARPKDFSGDKSNSFELKLKEKAK